MYKISVLLIILTLLITLVIFLTYSTPNNRFFSASIYPVLDTIHKDRSVILNEIYTIYRTSNTWMSWPEKKILDGKPNSHWKIFPYYAFGIWVDDNCKKTPTITKFIKSIKNLKLATLSKLSAGMKLVPHCGWGKHSNNVLRCHYGLIVPENKTCYVKVEDEVRYHKNDQWLVFDDSKLHMAENKSTKDRLVLIIDIERPEGIPKGNSKIGDTEELLQLVKYFRDKHQVLVKEKN
jgi:aspartyl/asparaginyl beta-hydroxylase (cupin superfamily)